MNFRVAFLATDLVHSVDQETAEPFQLFLTLRRQQVTSSDDM